MQRLAGTISTMTIPLRLAADEVGDEWSRPGQNFRRVRHTGFFFFKMGKKIAPASAFKGCTRAIQKIKLEATSLNL
jgi:hypothetical protein